LIVSGYLTPPAPVNGRPQTYPPTFFPGAVNVSAATTIELRAGEARGGVDIALRPVGAASVSGTVTGPPDVLPGLVVRLLPDGLEDLGTASEVATATIAGDGRFVLPNVPAGPYTLDIRRSLSELQYRTPLATQPVPLPTTPGTSATGGGSGSIASGPYGATYSTRVGRGNGAYFAQMRLAVDARGVTDLVVPLKRGVSIRGRLVTEAGTPPAPGPTGGGTVLAEPADGNLGLGMVRGTWPTPTTFEIDGLIGGQFLLRFLTVAGTIVSIVAIATSPSTPPPARTSTWSSPSPTSARIFPARRQTPVARKSRTRSSSRSRSNGINGRTTGSRRRA
jgi:hypothetical protein